MSLLCPIYDPYWLTAPLTDHSVDDDFPCEDRWCAAQIFVVRVALTEQHRQDSFRAAADLVCDRLVERVFPSCKFSEMEEAPSFFGNHHNRRAA